jgi:flagellar FliL protein
MSDAAPAETPSAAAPAAKSGGGSKLPLILAVINIAATGFVAMKVMKPPAAVHAAPAAPAATAGAAGPIVAMEPFVVNLNEAGSSRYLKATIELELTHKHAIDELDKAKRAVRDDVLRYLLGLSVADTLGEENKQKIQDNIVARIDKDLGGGRVKRIFFTEFVVQ